MANDAKCEARKTVILFTPGVGLITEARLSQKNTPGNIRRKPPVIKRIISLDLAPEMPVWALFRLAFSLFG